VLNLHTDPELGCLTMRELGWSDRILPPEVWPHCTEAKKRNNKTRRFPLQAQKKGRDETMMNRPNPRTLS